MSVATDLQTVIGRIGIAVAGGDTYGRVDLERLSRELAAIREQATKDGNETFSLRCAVHEIADVAESETVRIAAAARRVRARFERPSEVPVMARTL